MNSKKNVENTTTEWSAKKREENLMQKVLTAKERMLLTSRLYLKVEATPMESVLKPQARTVHSQESLAVQ